MDWTGKTVVITGGTGTIGHALTRHLLAHGVGTIRIFSRDEQKQESMARLFADESRIDGGRLRFFIGDVRNRSRLDMAVGGAHIVIHAAAMKIVPACAYNPLEALETNVNGTANVILACRAAGTVERAIFLSTDKACEPVTLYGATKALAEQLWLAAQVYRGEAGCLFTAVRYGNVATSRGSFLNVLVHRPVNDPVNLTDAQATRFWLTEEDAIRLIEEALTRTRGGDCFIPKTPAVRIIDLVSTVAPDAEIRVTGPRVQEKRHEVLITYEEARRTKDLGSCYVIEPDKPCFGREPLLGVSMTPGFRLTSNGGESWVASTTLREQAKECM